MATRDGTDPAPAPLIPVCSWGRCIVRALDSSHHEFHLDSLVLVAKPGPRALFRGGRRIRQQSDITIKGEVSDRRAQRCWGEVGTSEGGWEEGKRLQPESPSAPAPQRGARTRGAVLCEMWHCVLEY